MSDLTIRRNSGVDVGTRPRVNLIEGAGIVFGITDDALNAELDVVVTAHGEVHVLGTTTGPHTGALPWADLDKSGSSLADLTTRAHSDLSDAPADAHHAESHGAAQHSAESDAEAIHENVAGEIAALTEKTTPVNADLLVIEDSASAPVNQKKKLQVGNLPGGGGGSQDVPLLDGSEHNDTVAQAVTRGSLIYGSATPKWDELPIGSAGDVLYSDGTDVKWLHPIVYALSIPGRTPNGAAVVIDRFPIIRAGTVTRYRILSLTNDGPVTTNLVFTITHYNSSDVSQWSETSKTLSAGSNDSGDTALSATRTLVAGGYLKLETTTSNATAMNILVLLYDQ